MTHPDRLRSPESLEIKTIASLILETWAITPTSLLKKNLTYSLIVEVYFMKSLDAAKASLVFIKNRRNSSHLQMFFKIGVLKNFVIFTGKQLRFFLSFFWSFFLIKLQAFRCFSMSISILLRAAFFIEHLRWRLQQMLSYIIFSKRRC